MPDSARTDVWELNRQRSVKDQVIDAILARMCRGELAEESPLPPENVLCREMKISRSVLREAIKQLQVLGFVRIVRGVGTVVTRPGLGCALPVVEFLGRTGRISFGELHDLRALVEVEAVGLVAARHEDQLVHRLDEILREAEAFLGESLGYVDLDVRFHQTILRACPNRLLAIVLEPFEAYLWKSRELSFANKRDARRALEAHRGILDAVAGGDEELARQRMDQHLKQTSVDLDLAGMERSFSDLTGAAAARADAARDG